MHEHEVRRGGDTNDRADKESQGIRVGITVGDKSLERDAAPGVCNVQFLLPGTSETSVTQRRRSTQMNEPSYHDRQETGATNGSNGCRIKHTKALGREKQRQS